MLGIAHARSEAFVENEIPVQDLEELASIQGSSWCCDTF